MPPRSTAAPLLGFTVVVCVGVVVAWQWRGSYLPELDGWINTIDTRFHLVPAS